ncbi:50S ribosomal protein L4 [Candidatus Peribacteria bacterium RIFCSPHIGHO2_02_FULL_52_16]|nr:MAG: 50S ribosomal protein L4 [Candidatus Peribacteria bacterium RIFCSPHIGHO2_01_FULL_51_35]OGJ61464.1 MAG: 50S ribosomal protein L4 [Candidatus Peribacteria bacterium RIFCSPHIGHO2_02_FULL_52_16]
MNIDLYTASGTKKGTLSLPASLFEAPIKKALMHQALIRQQSNRRSAIAHAKTRGEVVGSTKKVYAQKHTGRARRGPIRSPLLRGGGKAFGPRNNANFIKDMPKSMRRAALLSCFSAKAKEGAIIGLESYPDTMKTKDAMGLLKKLPVQIGRRILVVCAEPEKTLHLSTRNIPNVTVVYAAYLNPEDVLVSRHIIFLEAAVKKAEELWGAVKERAPKVSVQKEVIERKPMKPKSPMKPAAKKSSPKAKPQP